MGIFLSSRASISRRKVLLVYPALTAVALAREVPEFHYETLKSLWEDLQFNQIKRNRLINRSSPVIVQIPRVKVFMVLEGKDGSAGTVVVTDSDAEGRPPIVAYINIPMEFKKDCPPLEDVRKGGRVGVVGILFAISTKGSGKGQNPVANAIHMMLGKFWAAGLLGTVSLFTCFQVISAAKNLLSTV